MNPQQQPYQPSKTGSEYDFFLNPEKSPKVSRLHGLNDGNKSFGSRILTLVGAAAVTVIILYVIFSIVTGGSGNKPKLIIVAQDQNELIRVATLTTTIGQNQSAQSTQNFAQSAILSLTTEQQQLLDFMATHGGQPNAGQLAATKDTSSDTTLNNAVQASNFDPAFVGIMQNQLKNYRADLRNAFQTAHNDTEKQLLSDDFGGASLLLQQLNSPTQ